MPSPLRIGVIGLGQRGLQHLAALRQLQQEGVLEIVALGDAFPANLTPEKLRQFVPGLPAESIERTTNIQSLINADLLDALYIAIPPNVHQGEVVAAAQAGIHLFVEKPMSLYLDEALEMENAIREAGVISTVGFQQRYDSQHEALHDFLADKPVVMACYTLHAPIESHSVKHTFTETVGGPSNRVWTANRAWSGGTVVEAGIHPLDLWRYWFGDVEWVQAQYIQRPPAEIYDGADNPYAYSAHFGFANGALGVMTLSRLRRVFASYGDHQVLWNEGRVQLEHDSLIAFHYDGDYPPAQRLAAESVRHQLHGKNTNNTTYEIAAAFVRAVQEKRQELVRSSFSDAMNSLAAVIAANVSDELGGVRVEIDELMSADKYADFRAKK
ncbi:MAG: gfo/Idh/MocA family oxidoreductase [Chloroflexi bacterium]|nr:MAG: gfo/Idh/MocA family oxidoreductase [Chloroflexota bacterium]